MKNLRLGSYIEIAWQRIDNQKTLLLLVIQVSAQIINIEGSKIFLSMKKLKEDPWARVNDKYTEGQVVKGKVLKINPFGLFVELDPEIHGLAHISELSHKPVADMSEIAKPGDVIDLKIISIEPKNHRLGLSIKALTAKPETEKKQSTKKTDSTASKSETAETATENPKETTDEVAEKTPTKKHTDSEKHKERKNLLPSTMEGV